MAEERKYWLHRITGGPNATKLSHPLLFKHNILSTGWSSLSYDDFVEKSKDDWKSFEEEFNNEYPGLRNRNCLWRFLKMKKGDWVVVPTWGTFSIYEIADDNIYTNQSLFSLIASKDLYDWDEKLAYIKQDENGYYCLYDEAGEYIDLGFYRKVKSIEVKLSRQEYADNLLYSRMKIMQTNADITDLEESILRAADKKPIHIHKELLEATRRAAKETISYYVQHNMYEQMVEQYLYAIGADNVIKPAPNESKTEDGDADRVAYFEQLKVAVMVQVKKHENQTGNWAVEQIKAYRANHPNAEYSVQMWVISHADVFTDEAIANAERSNVRLINGDEFARMILEVGLKHFE